MDRKNIFLLTFLVLFSAGTPACANEMDHVASVVNHLGRSLLGLTGYVAENEEIEREIWYEVARQFLNYPEVGKLFADSALQAKKQGVNQKLAFLKILVDVACKSFEDGCQFRRDIEAIQKNDRMQDDYIYEHERRIGDLEDKINGRRHGSYYRGPIQNAPTPAEPRRPLVWRGGLDRITSNEDSLCRNALMIARCVEVPVARGELYHGNIYEDCRNQIVLVRHVKIAR